MSTKTENRRINIFVNGKQVKNEVGDMAKQYAILNQRIKKMSIGSKEYNRTVAKMRGLKGELRAHNQQLRGVESRWSKLKGMAVGYGPALLGAMAGRAILQGIRNGINTIKEYQDANAKLISVLGVTKEETKALRDQQLALGSSTAFTAGQVADAQTELAKLGFTLREITNLTPAVLNLAAASGTDLANAASIAGSTLRQFGLNSSETNKVVDVMAKSFSSSALDIEKFSVAMASAGPVANAAGVSLERTTALIGTLADRGLDASTAGTSLRNIFLDIAKAGLTWEEAMNQISTATDQNVAALDLFGKRGATTAVILANNADAAENLEEKLRNAGGAAQEMAEKQLDTLTGDVTKLQSAWEGLILSIENGEGSMGKAARSFTKWITNVVQGTSKLNSLSEETEKNWLQLIKVTSTGKVGILELFTDTPAILKNPLRLFGIDRIGWDRELLDLSNSVRVWSESAKEAFGQERIIDGDADLQHLKDLRVQYEGNESALKILELAITDLNAARGAGLSSALSWLNTPKKNPQTDPVDPATDEEQSRADAIKMIRIKLKDDLLQIERELKAGELAISGGAYGQIMSMAQDASAEKIAAQEAELASVQNYGNQVFGIMGDIAQATGESAEYQQQVGEAMNIFNSGVAIIQAASSVKAGDPFTSRAPGSRDRHPHIHHQHGEGPNIKRIHSRAARICHGNGSSARRIRPRG
jgi:hypothetical protein